jgi:protocatechuate 4,5-dioxygenase alpha chain
MAATRDNYVLDLALARRGFALNRLLGSLMSAENRARFGQDEAAYCAGYGLTQEQRRAVLDRDYPALLEQGASVFCAFKLTMTDRKTMQHLSAGFAGMSPEEFDAVMRAGGRAVGGQVTGVQTAGGKHCG